MGGLIESLYLREDFNRVLHSRASDRASSPSPIFEDDLTNFNISFVIDGFVISFLGRLIKKLTIFLIANFFEPLKNNEAQRLSSFHRALLESDKFLILTRFL